MGWIIAAALGYVWFRNQPSTASAIASAGNAATQAGAALQTVATDITGDPIAPNHKAIAPGILTYNAGAPLPVPPQMAPIPPSPIIPPLPVAPRLAFSAQRFALTSGLRQMIELE